MNIQRSGRLVQGAPVREYGSAEEMRRHAAELKARLMGEGQKLRPLVLVAKPTAVAPVNEEARRWVLVEEEKARSLEEAEAERLAGIARERDALRPDVPDLQIFRSRSRDIIKAIADHHGVSVAGLKSEVRTARMVKPRQLAMLAVWIECSTQSLPAIGRMFGGRDHTTVLHAIRKFTDGKVRAWPVELFWLRDLVVAPAASNEEGFA